MNKPNTQKGQVIIINTLLFFALSTAIIFAITSPVVSSFHITKSFSKSKEAFLLANSASSEALYKLNTGKNLASSETLTLSQGEAVITVADTMDGKTVSVHSDTDSYQRNYELSVSTGAGVSFNYGLQSGQGGFSMVNSAGIIGNIYSNGDITGTGANYVTGSAVAANITPVITAATNNGIVDPTNQINFGGNTAATPEDVAQSFTVSTTTPISSVRLLLKKTGSPGSNITVRIVTDSSSHPYKTEKSQGTISASTITSTFNYVTVPLSTMVALTPGTTYWLVLDTANLAGPTYSVGANNSTFSGGVAKLAVGGWQSTGTGGTWISSSPNTLDAYFDIYAGGSIGLIDGVTIGSAGVGDAWSHQVKNSTIAGSLYCTIGSNNGGKVCDSVSRADPVQQSMPLSDGNIDDWKNVAIAGGATSSMSLSGTQTRTVGPIKINGDLTLSGSSILYISGTVYVTGNISLSNFAQIHVDPSLGQSGVIVVTDGRVSTANSSSFVGTGASRSYVLLATTSSCPTGALCSGNPAIDIANAGGAVILNAQNGTIQFSNHAQAKQATAYKIVMLNDTTITYEEGLANPSFTTGPSGAWNVNSWKEVE